MQEIIDLKIRRLAIPSRRGRLPAYANPGDAGLDLVAVSRRFSEDGRYVEYGTGIAIEIPKGYVGLLFPRSSVSKYDLMLNNAVGVVDSSYRGEIIVRFRRLPRFVTFLKFFLNLVDCQEEYEIGDRIAQLIVMPFPLVRISETTSLSDTARDLGAFGSTGK